MAGGAKVRYDYGMAFRFLWRNSGNFRRLLVGGSACLVFAYTLNSMAPSVGRYVDPYLDGVVPKDHPSRQRYSSSHSDGGSTSSSSTSSSSVPYTGSTTTGSQGGGGWTYAPAGATGAGTPTDEPVIGRRPLEPVRPLEKR